jgi:hypothetical protein
MTSQLLIEMPAEGAARLLTLSLLEQMSQFAWASAAIPDPRYASRYAATYRGVVRRLRASLTLYGDALGDGLSRKARRRLRALASAAERLHRADVQLAWCARHVAAPGHVEQVGAVGDGARAAAWLQDRIARRRARAHRAAQRAQRDARPLRRIAKRLGVYTTDVRLDTVPAQQSFARLTSHQLFVSAAALGMAMRAAASPASLTELRRALAAAEHLVYLLEPLRAYADIETWSARVTELRSALERVDEVAMVGRAIVRGGRRIAAVQAGESLRAVIWRPSAEPAAQQAGATVVTSRTTPTSAELQRGMVVLAESLRDEAMRAFETVATVWQASAAAGLVEQITAIAGDLQA